MRLSILIRAAPKICSSGLSPSRRFTRRRITAHSAALQMIFGGHHASGTAEARRTPTEIAIFPVAMPGIASPGALLAVVLLTDNNRFSFGEETVTAGLTVAVL